MRIRACLPLAAACLVLSLSYSIGSAQDAKSVPEPSANELAAIAVVESRAQELIRISDEIWGYEEEAFQETQSARALADHAEANGFRVRRGLAGMPTAFMAEFGSGSPVVG